MSAAVCARACSSASASAPGASGPKRAELRTVRIGQARRHAFDRPREVPRLGPDAAVESGQAVIAPAVVTGRLEREAHSPSSAREPEDRREEGGVGAEVDGCRRLSTAVAVKTTSKGTPGSPSSVTVVVPSGLALKASSGVCAPRSRRPTARACRVRGRCSRRAAQVHDEIDVVGADAAVQRLGARRSAEVGHVEPGADRRCGAGLRGRRNASIARRGHYPGRALRARPPPRWPARRRRPRRASRGTARRENTVRSPCAKAKKRPAVLLPRSPGPSRPDTASTSPRFERQRAGPRLAVAGPGGDLLAVEEEVGGVVAEQRGWNSPAGADQTCLKTAAGAGLEVRPSVEVKRPA